MSFETMNFLKEQQEGHLFISETVSQINEDSPEMS